MKKYFFIVIVLLFYIVTFNRVNAQTSNFQTNLTIGSTGADVVTVQNWLENRGYLTMPPGIAKGYFGQLTRDAIIKFQLANGVVPSTGYFGPLTRAKINEADNGTQIPANWPTYTYKNYQFLSPGTAFESPDIENASVKVTFGSDITVADLRCPILETGYEAWSNIETKKRVVIVNNKSYPIELRTYTGAQDLPDFNLILINYNLNSAEFATSCQLRMDARLVNGDIATRIFESVKVLGEDQVTQLKITPDILPNAETNKLYTQVLNTDGFSGSMKWEIVEGSLPTGFGLEKGLPPVCPAIYPSTCRSLVSETYTGLLGGRTLENGVFNFTVKASDGNRTLHKPYTLKVNKGFSIKTDKRTYRRNEPIVITIEAFNETNRNKIITFPHSCQAAYRINLVSSEAETVYDSFESDDCIIRTSKVTIRPNRSHTWTLTHPANTLAAGTYRIFGSLTSNAVFQPINIVVEN